MTTLLNQIIAVEKGKKSKAEKTLTSAYHVIQKAAPLNGLTRTYQPKDDEGDRLPAEAINVQVKVDDLLSEVAAGLTELFDVTLTKETANASAKADVKVGDKVVVKDAPVTYLLFLEKQLVNLRTFVNALPTLDPAEVWSKDENTGAYVTAETQTVRTKKIPKVQVLYEATDKHPAQVQAYNEDVITGTWTLRKFSGAVPQTRKDELATRVETLLEAVKFAREEANSKPVTDVRAGKDVFDFLFS